MYNFGQHVWNFTEKYKGYWLMMLTHIFPFFPFIFHLDHNFPSLPQSCCPAPTFPLMHHGQASHGHQSIAYQVEAEPSSPPASRLSNIIQHMEQVSQKPAKCQGHCQDSETQLYNCHTHTEGLSWSHAGSLTVGPPSVSSQKPSSAVFVGSSVMTLTSLACTAPPPSLQQDSRSLTQYLAMDLHNCFQQLLV